MPRTVRGLPQTLEPGPSSRFQPPRPFERLPLCLFRKVMVVRRLSRVFPSGSSDVEENCLTPQFSSAVVRLVLQVKLYAVARNRDWAAVTASLCILAHVAQSCCTQAARMLKSRSSTCMWSARCESGTLCRFFFERLR